MTGSHEHTVGLVGRHEVIEVPSVRVEVGRITGRVDENPPVPLMGPRFTKGVVGITLVEARLDGHGWPPFELSIESIGPSVIGALDRLALSRGTAREKFVSPVTAGVVEGPELVVAPPDQKDAGAADLDRSLAAGLGEIVRPSDAHPRSREEVTALPLEDLNRMVGLGGQSAGVVKGPSTCPESLSVYGRHVGHVACSLNGSHTEANAPRREPSRAVIIAGC
jgi:hypothetical protein